MEHFKRNLDEGGTMPPKHVPHRKLILLPQFENEINEYLTACKGAYSESQQCNIKARCTAFMRFLQNRGLTAISDLGYEDILAYHADFPHKNRVCRMLYESSLKLFLSHLAEKRRCSHGLGWYLHYLQSDRIVVAEIPCEMLDPAERNPLPFSAQEYRRLFENLLAILKEEHLSRNMIYVYENAFKLHFIFLDMNGFHYCPARAIAWAEGAKGVFQSSWPTVRRAMLLFDDYTRTDALILGKCYPSKPSSFDLLPEWCRSPITEFVKQREKTKMSRSTINMDRISCVRFCEFLSSRGLVSFKDLTATVVKDFNVQDKHQTAEGKGAYNSRIRKFLKFLSREGYVTHASLYQAIGGAAASSEHIVITLNETEKQNLKAFHASVASRLELRDNACILLGTEMGIRGCDIVNLKIRDINWKERSICFRQIKTGTDVLLAMPVSVGNAVYHYLRDGRPKNVKCDYIFVTVKAPYRKLAPFSCRQALCRALPDRKVKGSGFHVTRKTFATERLRNNLSPDQIATAMGHVTPGSLTPYLSLDDERIGLCPLSIADLDIQLEGGFGNG